MDSIPAQCSARSLGAANQLVGLLVQSLLTSYCAFTDPGWPADCGENVVNGSSYDYIVIGAGSAGSVVAGRLSEDPNTTVLLLEAGDDPPVESEIPALFLNLGKSQYDWQYYGEANHCCLASNDNACYIPRGKMLGGSHGLNYLMYVRGNKKDYDSWGEWGNIGWNYSSVLQCFKRWEHNRNAKIANYAHGCYHNQTGPDSVSLFVRDRHDPILVAASKELGNRQIEQINADKTTGYLHHQAWVWNGTRQTSAKAYLIPAKDRPNLCIIKNALVYKILFDEEKRATGVLYEYKGQPGFAAFANKQVVLSAGTIESTKLLLLSGVGPKEQLDQFEIPTVSDSPVGKKMYDHVCAFLFFKLKGKAPPSTDVLDQIFNLLIHRDGPLTGPGALEYGGFVDSKNINGKWPDCQFGYFYFTQNGSGLQQYLELQNWQQPLIDKIVEENKHSHIVMTFNVLLQPKSVGSIELRSDDYKDPPLIRTGYLDDEDDLDTIVRAMKLQLEFETTKAFRKHKAEFISLPICSEHEFRSDEYLRCYAQHCSISLVHAVATSKMGPKSDNESVVSPRLCVRGVTGLSQADLGVAPYVPSGNTNALALMIGEKAAAIIKRKHC